MNNFRWRTKSVRLPVLYLTNNLPVPPNSGGQLREFQILRRLKGFFDVHLVAFVKDKANAAVSLIEALDFLSSATLVQVRSEWASPKLPPRVREHYTPEGQEIVSRMIRDLNPALVHIEGYFLAHYLSAAACCPKVVVAENIEFELERLGERYGFFSRGIWRATRDLEVETWKQAAHCVAVTLEDLCMIRSLTGCRRVSCVTNGMDHLDLSRPALAYNDQASITFLYVANYEWAPSLDAARHLLRDIWPSIRANAPNLRLLLAGSGIDREFRHEAEAKEGVFVWGRFQDFGEVAEQASVFLYPLRFGGGVKVKLIEAIAARLPVVTTSLALRGFPATLHPFISIAETPSEFAEAAVIAIRNKRLKVASAASAILRHSLPTWEVTAARLGTVWERTANSPGRG